ncbi:uncharacterized protein [Oscarella lobularis]|uniref:uncharacterized protein n=1 Tax=Oscarella lobularis TaxID=121494 RepID=UPI0033136D74
MFYLIVSLLGLLASAQGHQHQQLCSEAVGPCFADSDCYTRYITYTNLCSDTRLSLDPETGCSATCNESLLYFLSHPLAVNASGCDCGEDLAACRIPNDNVQYRCFDVKPAPKCSLAASWGISDSFCPSFVSQCLNDSACAEAYRLFWSGIRRDDEGEIHLEGGAAACGSPWQGGWCNPTCKQALYDFMCEWGKVAERATCQCDSDDEECTNTQISLANRIETACLADDERHSLLFCDNAESACRDDPVCAPLINESEKACGELINGRTKNCSWECLTAFGALDANPIGSYMGRCSCGSGNSFCQRRASYISFYCFGSPWDVPQLCNDVLDACYDDSTCNETRHRYLMACNPNLNDDYDYTCSPTCKKYAEMILRDPVGSVLNSCFCQITDEECLAYERITGNCFDSPTAPSPTKIPSTVAPPSPANIDYEKAFATWKASYDDWQVKYEEWQKDQCPDGS